MKVVILSKTCSRKKYNEIFEERTRRFIDPSQKFFLMLIKGMATQNINILCISMLPISSKCHRQKIWKCVQETDENILRYGRTFSISSIINNTINNFINPAAQYAKTHHQGSMTDPNLLGGGFMSLIVTFSGPLTIPAVVLPILYFDKLSFAYKIISIFGIILQVFGAVIAGTNEGLWSDTGKKHQYRRDSGV